MGKRPSRGLHPPASLGLPRALSPAGAALGIGRPAGDRTAHRDPLGLLAGSMGSPLHGGSLKSTAAPTSGWESHLEEVMRRFVSDNALSLTMFGLFLVFGRPEC
jgi:hypothetical protein